jgi:hypothetical protein
MRGCEVNVNACAQDLKHRFKKRRRLADLKFELAKIDEKTVSPEK